MIILKNNSNSETNKLQKILFPVDFLDRKRVVTQETRTVAKCWLCISLVPWDFYPINPANGIYCFGSPQLENAINLANGKLFKVTTNNAGGDNIYIQEIVLKGKSYRRISTHTTTSFQEEYMKIQD